MGLFTLLLFSNYYEIINLFRKQLFVGLFTKGLITLGLNALGLIFDIILIIPKMGHYV